jgi:hypothetical protein
VRLRIPTFDRVVAVALHVSVVIATASCKPSPPPTPSDDTAPRDASRSEAGSCPELVADAPPDLQLDLRTLCGASSYDGHCVGMPCARTTSRDALECMLTHDLDIALLRALASATNPAARAYAREGLTRRDGWTPSLIAAAVRDSATLELFSADVVDRYQIADAGVLAAILYPRPEELPADVLVAVRARAESTDTLLAPEAVEAGSVYEPPSIARGKALLRERAAKGPFTPAPVPALAFYQAFGEYELARFGKSVVTCARQLDKHEARAREDERARLQELERRARDPR